LTPTDPRISGADGKDQRWYDRKDVPLLLEGKK
jgi:hypothetical protein